MDKNSQLDKLSSEFLSKAGQIVTENIIENPTSFALSTKEVHVIEGSRSQIFRKPEYGKLVYSLENQLIKLKEYRKLLTFIKKEVKYFHDDTEVLRDLILQLLTRFLDSIGPGVTGQGHKKPTIPHISDLNKQLRSYLYDKRLEFVELIPLANFKSSIDEFVVDRHTRVRLITSDERNYFFNETKNYNFMGNDIYQFLIEISNNAEKGDIGRSVGMTEKTHKSTLALVTSFRLVTDGFIGHEFIFVKYKLPFLGYNAHLLRNVHLYHGDPYLFEAKYLPKLLRLYAILSKLQSNAQKSVIKIAIERFGLIYERKSPVDAVIDLAIALEILFSKEGEQKESITFKLAVRAANLLANTIEDRIDIFNKITRFYAVRSKLVHGSKAALNDEDNKLVKEARMILQTSMSKYLKKLSNSWRVAVQFSHDSFIDELKFS